MGDVIFTMQRYREKFNDFPNRKQFCALCREHGVSAPELEESGIVRFHSSYVILTRKGNKWN